MVQRYAFPLSCSSIAAAELHFAAREALPNKTIEHDFVLAAPLRSAPNTKPLIQVVRQERISRMYAVAVTMAAGEMALKGSKSLAGGVNRR
ncbi:hypothetical protein LCGC14_2804230 [marine sediment metagenome]|uniref:Uncharacterized protein n=1 Tax=marine sediment metagenome TaxID=412755 RepID=A0A0F9AV82_9ZZZZ